jgi:penicillin-binding protein 2
MLIFDELKKNDPQLRLVAAVLAGGLSLLLAGLWWVQIVSAREYENHLETQSYRTVRLPAVRGKILDRHGQVLAENGPQYNLSLYLDDLRKPFDAAYGQSLAHARVAQEQFMAAQEKKLGRTLTKAERKQFALTPEEREQLREQARFRVASDVVQQVSQQLGQPLQLDATVFSRHYEARRALPYPLLTNLDNSPEPWGLTWICSPSASIPLAKPRVICSAICNATMIRRKAKTRFLIIACRIIAAS